MWTQVEKQMVDCLLNSVTCRYVQSGSGGLEYSFVVPLKGCGSRPSRGECSSGSCGLGHAMDNVLVIQTDESVQVLEPSVFSFSDLGTDLLSATSKPAQRRRCVILF